MALARNTSGMALGRSSSTLNGVEVLCNLSHNGRLLELGRDPFAEAVHTSVASMQTDPYATLCDDSVKKLSNSNLSRGTSPAARTLKLIVGLLGQEVHEKPNTWAEVWLTFQDAAQAGLGIGPNAAGAKWDDAASRGQHDCMRGESLEWQARVLSHLQDLVANDVNSGKGPFSEDFHEQLEVAEYILRRIVTAVATLQGPDSQDRPMILREYTEECVVQVCGDLRQWLEQLATLLSIYHVCLLDAEAERRRLADELSSRLSTFKGSEEERQKAVSRYEQLQQNWKEEQMKQRAAALLGIQAQGEDALVYSQRDADEMQLEWEREQVDPLLEELRELKIKNDDLLDKLKDRGREMRELRSLQRTRTKTLEVDDFKPEVKGLDGQQITQLAAALMGFSERLSDEAFSTTARRLSQAVQSGGDGLMELVREVNDLPAQQPPSMASFVDQTDKDSIQMDPAASKCFETVASELENFEADLRRGGAAAHLAPFVKWASSSMRKSLAVCTGAEEAPQRWTPAPTADVSRLDRVSEKPPIKQVAVQTDTDSPNSAPVQPNTVELELRSRINSMQRELSSKIKEAERRASADAAKSESTILELDSDLRKADATIKELRRQLLEMQRLMKSKGLGKQLEAAMAEAGLTDMLQGDVFERLYKDAMDRMRRFAEAQRLRQQETSGDYLRAVDAVFAPWTGPPGALLPGPLATPRILAATAGYPAAPLAPGIRLEQPRDKSPVIGETEVPPLHVSQLWPQSSERSGGLGSASFLTSPEIRQSRKCVPTAGGRPPGGDGQDSVAKQRLRSSVLGRQFEVPAAVMPELLFCVGQAQSPPMGRAGDAGGSHAMQAASPRSPGQPPSKQQALYWQYGRSGAGVIHGLKVGDEPGLHIERLRPPVGEEPPLWPQKSTPTKLAHGQLKVPGRAGVGGLPPVAARLGSSASMPQLGRPPRLLMQNVGSY